MGPITINCLAFLPGRQGKHAILDESCSSLSLTAACANDEEGGVFPSLRDRRRRFDLRHSLLHD
jgi:hypothetical protein